MLIYYNGEAWCAAFITYFKYLDRDEQAIVSAAEYERLNRQIAQQYFESNPNGTMIHTEARGNVYWTEFYGVSVIPAEAKFQALSRYLERVSKHYSNDYRTDTPITSFDLYPISWYDSMLKTLQEVKET